MFTDLTIGTFMQPLKDTKEYWIFFVEMIYKLYKCDMIEFPDDEFPIRMLVGTKNLEEFYGEYLPVKPNGTFMTQYQVK